MSLFYSQKMNQSSSLMASLLRQQMKRELRRLDATDRDRALRKALASRQRTGAMAWDPMAAPCPWWSAADARAHAAWLHSPVPHPISWEELDPCQCWPAGQPVSLVTQGVKHLAFVRLEGSRFDPRWLSGSIPKRRVSPVELTTLDPRQVWADSYELQLALALLSAETDTRCAWLAGPYDPDEEPELEALYALALEELDRRKTALTGLGPDPVHEPTPRRGWTVSEIEALRIPEGVIEPVDLVPGR